MRLFDCAGTFQPASRKDPHEAYALRYRLCVEGGSYRGHDVQPYCQRVRQRAARGRHGRFVFPGRPHLPHYAERLAVFAVVSQIPYSLLFGATGNVLITLLIGLGMLWLVDRQRQNLVLCALGLLGGLAVSSFCDWGIIGPLMIMLFWHLHDRPRGVALAMLVPFLGL